MTGRIASDVMAESVQEELENLQLAAALVEKNLELARLAFVRVKSVRVASRPRNQSIARLHQPAYVGTPDGVPIIYAAGNSAARHTGSWRIYRPTIDYDACTRCRICQLRCPDAAIVLDAEGYPIIDYDNCKGCMICARECPIRCILEEKEVRAW